MLNPLKLLLLRIAGGERLERGSKADTVRWLAVLTTVPLMGLLVGPLIPDTLDWDHRVKWRYVLAMVVVGLVMLGVWGGLVRLFRNHPMRILPLAGLAWGLLAWLVWGNLD